MANRMITTEEAEKILTKVIDDLYVRTKNSFVDYKSKTHKLGYFKEIIKADFHRKLQEL